MNDKNKNIQLTVTGTCFLLILIFIVTMLAIGLANLYEARIKPEVVIYSMTTQHDVHYGKITVIDYTVGGISSIRYFYPFEQEAMDYFLAELERTGTIRRFTK